MGACLTVANQKAAMARHTMPVGWTICTCGFENLESIDLQILPDDQRLDGAHVQTGQRVLDAEHELVGVLADLVKEFADEPLFLNKLHVCKGVG